MYACVLFLVFNCDCNEPCRRSGSRRVAGAGGESTEMFAVIGRASLRRLAIPLLHDPSNDFAKQQDGKGQLSSGAPLYVTVL